jgi:hypothetical protein
VSDAIDKHIAKAFASLDDVPKRELEATSEALTFHRHPLHDFSGVFYEVAWTREEGSDPHLARFHVRQFASRADDDVLVLLEKAQAPFWRHVREAILASRKEAASHQR